MNDHEKTKAELISDLSALRRQLAQNATERDENTSITEDKWRAVVSNAPIFFAMVDRDGTICFLNHTQPGTTVEEAIGRSVFDYTMPQYHQALQESLNNAYEKGECGFFESVADGPNGTKSWYETYVTPVAIDGRVSSTAFIAMDITKRKRAEQRLDQERIRSEEYINIAGVILLALDATGHIQMLNRRGHELLGYRQESLKGRNWFDFVPERERADVLIKFNDLMNESVEITEFHENSIVTQSGEERVIAWHNNVLTKGGVERIGTLSSGTDVTDQKRAQRILKRAHDELETRVWERTAELTDANARLSDEIDERRMAEEQLQAIYDGMVDGLLITDIRARRFVRANASICRMLGYSADELLGMSAKRVHPPADLPYIMSEVQTFADRALTKKKDQCLVTNNIPMLRADGSIFYTDVTASHIIYGGAPCVISFVRDVSERRESQQELQREHQLLRDLLRAQDRERQLIAYEIHDGLAQQLIGSIMQFESITHLVDSSQEAKASCSAGLNMLRKSLAEARRLIGGLRPPILDELGVIAAVGHVVHELTAQSGLKIEYRNDVQFDRLEPSLENTIYRIAQECLTNARRHSQSETIRIELVQHGERLHITVTDWGIGFDLADEREGNFGLEGIKQRARLLGGSATVKTALGKGTQVNVEIPLAASP